jgi:hypothetical protein
LLADEARARVEELEAEVAELRRLSSVSLELGHIPVSWVEHANGSVGLDACGNITVVRMDEGFYLEPGE